MKAGIYKATPETRAKISATWTRERRLKQSILAHKLGMAGKTGIKPKRRSKSQIDYKDQTDVMREFDDWDI